MSHRKQWIVGALVGVSIGLAVYILSVVPAGVGELGLATLGASFATAWWKLGQS